MARIEQTHAPILTFPPQAREGRKADPLQESGFRYGNGFKTWPGSAPILAFPRKRGKEEKAGPLQESGSCYGDGWR